MTETDGLDVGARASAGDEFLRLDYMIPGAVGEFAKGVEPAGKAVRAAMRDMLIADGFATASHDSNRWLAYSRDRNRHVLGPLGSHGGLTWAKAAFWMTRVQSRAIGPLSAVRQTRRRAMDFCQTLRGVPRHTHCAPSRGGVLGRSWDGPRTVLGRSQQRLGLAAKPGGDAKC